ncbi:hypothetical protein [Pseudalkalibacillus salsuginis]|uniref:hypothetical protein n=1 Tax=Pseudalkalibacillus salsuginis TaxID=2910972 RepID=UPI001F1612C2|nr:hypothetical protein [Pseudalkalibacillus salsuginis]MCF6411963.1 hypothetical protein [Pseudalkalibacillus salsuginis]
MVTNDVFMKLVEVAEKMDCKVVFGGDKKISFNPNMTITVPLSATLENAYALAHEIGHLIDYKNGELDHDSWLNDWSYRVTVEMSAWVHAYKLLSRLGISTDGYHAHVEQKLSTYFQHHEVVV